MKCENWVGNASFPSVISLDKLDEGTVWSGQVDVKAFRRLFELLYEQAVYQPLSFDCRLVREGGVLWLRWQVEGAILLLCQRCLQKMSLDLSGNYGLALLDDASQVGLLGDGQDYVLLGEVCDKGQLALLKMLEDELLLSVPVSPKHEDCSMVVSQVGDIPEVENENPFAVLAGLKGNLS